MKTAGLGVALVAAGAALAVAMTAQAEPLRGPAANATVLIVEPEVRLAKMAVAGNTEPRPEWSALAQGNIALHARNAVLSGGRQAATMARDSLSPQARQVLVLNDAVRVSMRQSEDGDPPPATMPRSRAWTLGSGAKALRGETDATHALIIEADGEITGTLRALYVVGAAATGVLAPTGLQRASAVLVDLETGDIVWRNAVVARPDEDMRDPEGAHRLVTSLLKGAPL